MCVCVKTATLLKRVVRIPLLHALVPRAQPSLLRACPCSCKALLVADDHFSVQGWPGDVETSSVESECV